MRNVLIAQLILISIVAGLFLMKGSEQAVAALYGGAIAFVNSLLIARRISRANRVLDKDPKADVFSLYIGAVERFVVTLVAMAIGMGWLKLDPMALLVGFGAAYFGHPLSRMLPSAGPQGPGVSGH